MAETALITRTGQTSPASSSEPSLSEPLSELLASGTSKVVGPKTAAGLRAYVDGPWPELERPTADRVDSMIGRLALATKERRLSIAETKERLGIYWRVLRDVPLVDLAAGFDKLLATCTFMPTPAEVRAACAGFTAMREYRRSRARHLIWRHEQEWRAPVEPVPAEEIAGLLASLHVGGKEAQADG